MRVMILHTPADDATPGLLPHLREILERGAIEVETLVCSETGLPLPCYAAERLAAHGEELRAEIKERFEEWRPDAVVLSDRLNGSKFVARSLAEEMGIGVLVLKESVFPGRVFFAPEGCPPVSETDEEPGCCAPLEEYQRYRLERAVGEAYRIDNIEISPLPPVKSGQKTALAIIDHSTHDSDGAALKRTWAVVEECKKRGDRVVLCERWRDVCSDHADCGRYVLLMEGDVSRRIPCGDEHLRGLVRASDWCVTNGSLHALEALYLGRPVVLTDRCVYSGYGFTFDLMAGGEAGRAVETVSRLGRIDGARKEKLLKFLYGFLFRDLLVVDEAKQKFRGPSERRVLEALFRALPLERGARVLAGAMK